MLDVEMNIDEIKSWRCENCLQNMKLISVEGKIFWCPECGTISNGFPNPIWRTPKKVENEEQK